MRSVDISGRLDAIDIYKALIPTIDKAFVVKDATFRVAFQHF